MKIHDYFKGRIVKISIANNEGFNVIALKVYIFDINKCEYFYLRDEILKIFKCERITDKIRSKVECVLDGKIVYVYWDTNEHHYKIKDIHI